MNSAGKTCLYKLMTQGKVHHLLSLSDSMIPNNAAHSLKGRLLPQKVIKSTPQRKMSLLTMTLKKLMNTILKMMRKLWISNFKPKLTKLSTT